MRHIDPDLPISKTHSTPAKIHDFTEKLRQPALRGVVLDYVQWRRACADAEKAKTPKPEFPSLGPVSINLDLTTTCNFACGHCIDWDALNTTARHQHEDLLASLKSMHARGLKSVILLGGGEPTLYPKFADVVRFLKSLGLQVAVVTNGSRNEVIEEVAHLFTSGDWVRLSLDSGLEETFQAMHRPKSPSTTLEAICTSAKKLKSKNSNISLGFSFVITWKGASRGDEKIIENIAEMELATQWARDYDFDYISFKPFLTRASEGAEVMDPNAAQDKHEKVLKKIQDGLQKSKEVAGDSVAVIESTNLRVLLDGTWQQYLDQPKVCHMQALRQVVSPLGVFNCPAHRGVDKARIGSADAWKTELGAVGTAAMLESFDASKECKEVTCLYNPVNHWLDSLIQGEGDPADQFPEGNPLADTFL